MKIKEWIENNKAGLIRDVCALTEIPSVSCPGEGGWPFGTGCRQVLNKALALAKEIGLETENYENYCASAVLKGETDQELGFFSHLDVVPEGTGWTVTQPYT
ncbi:MAG: succinyl-diaminopimelate desuccinylase, partial [Clostridiaceae bacterium]|nr:succinyl-diaminopimelate desuccinylase [Clostridiaceae bacterium]